jgi:hypothetical protein
MKPYTGDGPGVSCGDFDIRIARDGTWYYHDSPIRRMPLVRLFASTLRRDTEGTYWLVTPAEKGRVTVEDAPFTAVELDVSGTGPDQVVSFRTNVDDTVEAGPHHPIRVSADPESGEPRPYVMIRQGLEARLLRSVFYHLVDLGSEEIVEGTPAFGVWSNGTFFPLGDTNPAV